MKSFNNGKAFHGSDLAMGGGIRGATDTDYFNFFCPKCPNNRIMRVLDFNVVKDTPGNKYDDQFTLKSGKSFVIALKLHCEECSHTDFVKVSNIGWQGGTYEEALSKAATV